MVPAMINVVTPRGLDGRDEVRVVPRVDLSTACDVFRMRRVLVNLGDQGAVWTLWYGCARDDGDLGQGRHLGESRGVGAQYRHLHVLDGLEQATLMIDQKQHGIVGFDDWSLPVEIGDCVHDEVLP